MIVCKFCSGPHPWWDCRKKPEEWKPKFEAQKPAPAAEVSLAPDRLGHKRGRPRIEKTAGKSKRAAEILAYMRQRRAKAKP